jgi:hypothetical protein
MADTEIIPMIDLGPYLAGSRLTPRWQGDGTVRDQQVAGCGSGHAVALEPLEEAGDQHPLCANGEVAPKDPVRIPRCFMTRLSMSAPSLTLLKL